MLRTIQKHIRQLPSSEAATCCGYPNPTSGEKRSVGPCASGSKMVLRKLAPTTVTTGLVWALQLENPGGTLSQTRAPADFGFFFVGIKKGSTSETPS